MDGAIAREKAIKEWKRTGKIVLIEASNPEWRDFYEELGRLGSGFRRNDRGDRLPTTLEFAASRLKLDCTRA